MAERNRNSRARRDTGADDAARNAPPGALDDSGDAEISAAGSDDIEASGAIVEGSVKSDIDVSHPAVDNNPRANTTVNQNKIDFNDPTQDSTEAVRAAMGYKEPSDDAAPAPARDRGGDNT